MKRILALSLFAMAAFVSQALAAKMCLYGSGDCWPADAKNCEGGWVFEGGKQGEGTMCEGGTFVENGPKTSGSPPTSVKPSIGCCKFTGDTSGKCWDVQETSQASDCQTGTNVFWSSACPDKQGTCPTGTPTYDGGSKPSLGCCKWANTTTNPDGKCWDVLVAAEAADCKTGDNVFWEGKCPDGAGTCPGSPPVTPILKFPAGQALLVAPYGRSLHISSVRDAMVSLYDMSGAKVYSGRVRAGNSVFSLEKVASGSYYAVVQSGSDAKKVPVILK